MRWGGMPHQHHPAVAFWPAAMSLKCVLNAVINVNSTQLITKIPSNKNQASASSEHWKQKWNAGVNQRQLSGNAKYAEYWPGPTQNREGLTDSKTCLRRLKTRIKRYWGWIKHGTAWCRLQIFCERRAVSSWLEAVARGTPKLGWSRPAALHLAGGND